MRRSLLLVLLLIGCQRPVPVTPAAPAPDAGPVGWTNAPRCPAITEGDAAGGALLGQDCTIGSGTCRYGDHDCRCQAPLGGAARAPRWACHRARHKPGGCPDDDQLIQGGTCTSEGQVCTVQLPCECSWGKPATCAQGRWDFKTCPGCTAP
jgi:hypothetical protein